MRSLLLPLALVAIVAAGCGKSSHRATPPPPTGSTATTTTAETTTVTGGRATVSREGDLVPLPDQIVQQRREQTGNAALLGKAMEALSAIRAIWGLDAPKRQDVTTAGEPMKAYVGIDLDAV